ncbi:uncharacterized protein B0H18DRAFT_986005 [Fomitopsis serialis]|uniref:uncharacterized protein n=1 Tax=Fomitopsis serialis TaxID=139415 RepID=UPI0020080A83|nr:uncharacterized protein B0H18DRAFT_986005 [Neoantrodia serialis]KAH9932512.1 hypothetical protein B0H18DRAFT_986005 [Neoantrodia serialis]
MRADISYYRATPPPSPTFLIARSIAAQRARPTLAMSMQIHAPAPIMSTSSRARGRSQPGSPLTQAAQLQPPQRPPIMARPSSRLNEHDRMLYVHPLPSPKLSGVSLPGSPFLAPTGTMLLNGNGSPPMSSQAAGDTAARTPHPRREHLVTPAPQGLSRTRSITQSSRTSAGAGDRAYSDSVAQAQVAYGTPSSPSPARAHLQRSAPSAPPHVGRAAHTQRTSPERSPAVPPHEAGVLRGAKEQERREKSSERRYRGEPGSSSGSGHSMASSRNLSAESDLFFGAVGESSVTSLSSAESKASPTATAPSRGSFSASRPQVLQIQSRSPMHSPSTPLKQLHGFSSPQSLSSANGLSPLTPPPTPPFNARTAAEQCRAMDGYVSFANIAGLGVPEGAVDEDMDEDDDRGRWWRWSESASSIGVAS